MAGLPVRSMPLVDTPSGTSPVSRPWWRSRLLWLCLLMFVVYATAIILDMPMPAGARYEQAVSSSVLAHWNTAPVASAQPAAHWWDKLQGLRGWSLFPEGWFWPKLPPPPLRRWLPVIFLGLAGIAGLRLAERRTLRRGRWRQWLALGALVCFAYSLQIGALWLKSANPEQLLVDRITDSDFTGYLTSALATSDISAFFSNYDITIRSADWCNHCLTHPPGPVLFYWTAVRGVEQLPIVWQEWLASLVSGAPRPDVSPAVVIVAALGAHFTLLGAAFIVLPLYGLARRLAGPQLALPLAAAGAVLPGMVVMSPEFDQFYGSLAASVLYLGIRGLQSSHHQAGWAFGAGLLLAFSTYWSFGLLILAAPLALLLIAATVGMLPLVSPGAQNRCSPGRMPRSAAALWLLALGLGASLPWVLLWTISGFPLLSILQWVRQEQLGGITAVRPFGPWLFLNLVDFLQFLGLPLALIALVTLFWRKSVNVFGAIFWVVVLALDFSGTTRGEVSRLWIPLMPLGLLAVFSSVGRGQLTITHVHGLLAAQFGVCVLIAGNWLTP